MNQNISLSFNMQIYSTLKNYNYGSTNVKHVEARVSELKVNYGNSFPHYEMFNGPNVYILQTYFCDLMR